MTDEAFGGVLETLKARDITAQGNALGKTASHFGSLNGCTIGRGIRDRRGIECQLYRWSNPIPISF